METLSRQPDRESFPEDPARLTGTLFIEADFTGFVVPDRFLVGYGLDRAERHRQLPYLGILDSG